jgi:hypothetical protein
MSSHTVSYSPEAAKGTQLTQGPCWKERAKTQNDQPGIYPESAYSLVPHGTQVSIVH